MDEIFESWSWRDKLLHIWCVKRKSIWMFNLWADFQQTETNARIQMLSDILQSRRMVTLDKKGPDASGLKMDICGESICFRRLCNSRGPLGSCRAAWCEKAAARVFHFHFFDGFSYPKRTKLQFSSNACAFLVLYCRRVTNLYSRVEG